MAAMAAKFREWCDVEAYKAEAYEDDDVSPAAFLASGSVGATVETSGPFANHKTLVCRKSEDISAEEFRKECLNATWSRSHECSPFCAKCGEEGHVSARHKHHEADTELYEESRKQKGSSASGPSASKCSKSVSPEESKDLENQPEKAHLEGVREGREKREANPSSSQGSSKQGGAGW